MCRASSKTHSTFRCCILKTRVDKIGKKDKRLDNVVGRRSRKIRIRIPDRTIDSFFSLHFQRNSNSSWFEQLYHFPLNLFRRTEVAEGMPRKYNEFTATSQKVTSSFERTRIILLLFYYTVFVVTLQRTLHEYQIGRI